tara:strand:+ start:1327 stop:1620 length:294 start_codon:yes stop_codon:yes gene_type:complete
MAGIFSAFLISIMFIPQILRVYKRKEAQSLSYAFLFVNVLASILGIIYSLYFEVIPMYLANASAFASSCGLIYLKSKYANAPAFPVAALGDAAQNAV